MGRKRLRTDELIVRRDHFLQLPDEIISRIISLVPVREAVRTSIISKRWRYIWTCHSDLKLDFINVLGTRAYYCRNNSEFESKRQVQRRKYLERVDIIMRQRSMGTKINSLSIHFHLGKEFSSHIDSWISCAVMKGVKSIDIDLSESSSFSKNGITSNAFEHYEFHSSLLAPPAGGKCNLKNLRLNSCILSAPLSSKTLNSLITVELRHVCINDEMLEDLLLNCLLLKKLGLHLCQYLVNLKFAEQCHQLEFLNIKDCFRLNEIKIYSESLRRVGYTGPPVSFSFKNVHKLSEVYLSFTQLNRIHGVTYALTQLASELPQLEKLNLLSILSMKALELPDDGPVFTNVKHLVLSVYPFDDDDRLGWIAYILRVFPLLQKLQLNLFSPSFIKHPRDIERQIHECPHRHLAELEINGFYGNQHEVELLTYLLENVISLGRLVIRTSQKIFKDFDNWVCEEANSFNKSRIKTVSCWLHEVLPKNTHLEDFAAGDTMASKCSWKSRHRPTEMVGWRLVI